MTSDSASGGRRAPAILCAGIIVLDEVFRVESFPPPDGKVQAKRFFVVNGGCAANAAVAIARLGGRAALAGPLGGPAGEDGNGDRVLAALAREQRRLQRLPARSPAWRRRCRRSSSTPRGDRMIVTYRDARIAAAHAARTPPASLPAPTRVLADNRFPDFVRPICAAARARGMTVVLDADRPTSVSDDAVPDRHPRGVFKRVPARHHGSRRPRRRARPHRRRDAEPFWP